MDKDCDCALIKCTSKDANDIQKFTECAHVLSVIELSLPHKVQIVKHIALFINKCVAIVFIFCIIQYDSLCQSTRVIFMTGDNNPRYQKWHVTFLLPIRDGKHVWNAIHSRVSHFLAGDVFSKKLLIFSGM